MWPTSTVQQAISAVLCIAEARGEPMRASTIAAATGAAGNYLSKILHSLARAGVLSSERGPRGGFRLALFLVAGLLFDRKLQIAYALGLVPMAIGLYTGNKVHLDMTSEGMLKVVGALLVLSGAMLFLKVAV